MKHSHELTLLETPSLLLDRNRLVSNCQRMQQRMQGLGVKLRPHMKTAKSADVARLAASSGAITVSTLKEAEYFAEAGFTDILYAVGITPDKIKRASRLRKDGVDLIIVTDNIEAVKHLDNAAAKTETSFRTLIEVDTGDGRAGVEPSSDELVTLAQAIHNASNLDFAGVFTHAGQSYGAASHEDIKHIAEKERGEIVMASQRLAELGYHCDIVAPGSTPTAALAQNLDGVTEMRPGVFVFGDLHQAALGSCSESDLALCVLTQVIGHNPRTRSLLVDAGGLALSKDLSASNFGLPVGYGRVADLDGTWLDPGMHVHAVSQEHGQVRRDDKELPDFSRFPVGTRLRIFPNHACMTAAAYEYYQVTEDNRVTGIWPRINGW